MADRKQVNRLKRNIDEWNQWRLDHPEVLPELILTNLSRANLGRADLYNAILSDANLSRANLSGASLYNAILTRADLSGANLSGADLSGTQLISANLSGANLRGANLTTANLTEASVGWTIFCDLDLRSVKGLKALTHHGPSSIGTDTILRSEGNIPEAFLRGAGLDDTFIDYVLSLARKPIQYYSCFLSYSNRDQNIVDRLHADLQSKGVRCWYAPHELKPGDYYRHEIDQSIRVYDKLVPSPFTPFC